MDQAAMDGPVTLVIRAPNQKYGDQTINCQQDWTVERLKAHLSDVYPSKPSSKDQRLVYSGKLLLDHFTLKDVLRKQDEYHMLHLVCASRTPPSSPKPRGSRDNKPPEGPAAPPVPPNLGQTGQASVGSAGPDAGTSPLPQMYSGFPQQATWTQYLQQPAPPIHASVYYSPMSLMWWQQLYAWQYHLHYQLLLAASHQPRPDQAGAQLRRRPDAANLQPQAERHGNMEVQMNAQGGEILNEDELNRDWLDWVYTFSRAAILLSIVYFYSSFSRFVMVMVAMLVLYLHQAGLFPFNLENDLQLPGDAANPDEADGDLQHHEAQDMEGATDDGSDEDGESGEEGAEDPNSLPHAGFLSSTWSFIITFFMSLIPEGPPNAAN